MAAKQQKYTVQRDFWDADGQRIAKGAEVEMTAEEAQDGVESGALKRVKD